MQVVKGRGFEKRAQYYAAKAYSRQLMEGDRYHKLKEIIFLAITKLCPKIKRSVLLPHPAFFRNPLIPTL